MSKSRTYRNAPLLFSSFEIIGCPKIVVWKNDLVRVLYFEVLPHKNKGVESMTFARKKHYSAEPNINNNLKYELTHLSNSLTHLSRYLADKSPKSLFFPV